MALYLGLNNAPGVESLNEKGEKVKLPGKGIDFYLGGEEFAGAHDENAHTFNNLFIDAFNMVFFSLGVCVGVMYSFSSYNQIRKPVIADAFIVALLDFLFSFFSGFIAWGAIGFLFAKKDPAFTETKSVALAFVALPSAASAGGGVGMLELFYCTLFFAGITSAAGYVEAFACNIIDQFHVPRWKAILTTIVMGILLSLPFCSNFGWILFDLTEHYITSYIVIMVGLL
jgi:SNF family Na+-dependent transporter